MNKILASVVIFFIRIYQLVLSPDKGIPSFWLKGKICMHTPHCSQYSIEVLQRYGFIPGIFMAMERVSSCHPWNDRHYDPSHFKVVFLSSAPIGVPFLEKLSADNRFEVVGVVTATDKPVGRGLHMQENIIKSTAKSLGINEIKTPEKINPSKSEEGKEFLDWLQSKQPDFLVVIAYGKIMPQSILDIPYFGPINVHGSVLPKYRGASPIQSVLLNGEKESGLTIMHMDAKMDEGDMIKILKFNLPLTWTSKDIIEKMQSVGPGFLNDTLWEYGKGLIFKEKQDSQMASYCRKIEKEDGNVSIYEDLLEIVYNKYRAYFLRPKIHFNFVSKNGETKRIIIENIIVDEGKYEQFKDLPLLDKNNVLNPAVIELGVKPEGKKLISFDEFKKGNL